MTGELRVNVNLPPADKMRGSGLTIRAWDPSLDPVVSPRGDWEVDARLSHLSSNAGPYCESPVSDLESSFNSLSFGSGANTPTGGPDVDGFSHHPQMQHHPGRTRGRLTKNGSRGSYGGPSPNDQQQMRGGFSPVGFKPVVTPRGYPQTPPAMAGGQPSPRWGHHPQSPPPHQTPPHHQSSGMARGRHGGGSGRRKANGESWVPDRPRPWWVEFNQHPVCLMRASRSSLALRYQAPRPAWASRLRPARPAP